MKIRQKIGDQAGEASTWHALASIDVEKGNYKAARKKFGKAMNISQQIDNRAGEASTWHALASIDLEKGNYEAAQEKFETALKIRQQIGNLPAEAATIHQLGFLAWELGRSQEGLRLLALAYLMLSSIGHANAKGSYEVLTSMASKLRYTQKQLEALQKEVAEAYQKDRGQSLIDAAFPKGGPDASPRG
jgi:tetratricopeptide (TPR) repeat protein